MTNSAIRVDYFEENVLREAPLVGRKVSAAFINADKTVIRLDFSDGGTLYLQTEGDCCSETWIEHVNNFDLIVGATITGTGSKALGSAIPTRQESDQLYSATLICIDSPRWRGAFDVDIEFRNSSNGYYGGEIYITAKCGVKEWLPLTEDF